MLQGKRQNIFEKGGILSHISNFIEKDWWCYSFSLYWYIQSKGTLGCSPNCSHNLEGILDLGAYIEECVISIQFNTISFPKAYI